MIGINIRIISLILISILFISYGLFSEMFIIILIFIFISIFSISGGFANVNYTDILGKSILQSSRKRFFSIKQVTVSIGVLISGFFARAVIGNMDYPNNYITLFFIASILLLFASLGFWKIKEVQAVILPINSFSNFIKIIIYELKKNKKFSTFLLILNTQGLTLILMPFLILYAKNNFNANSYDIGNYLLLKIMGGIITGSILFFFSKRIKYTPMLYVNTLLSIIIPLSIILFPGKTMFPYIFLLGGATFTFQAILVNGILLEITTNKNRALYTGLSGIGTFIPVIFPLIGGWIINIFNFNVFFIIVIVILLISLFPIYKLQCKK